MLFSYYGKIALASWIAHIFHTFLGVAGDVFCTAQRDAALLSPHPSNLRFLSQTSQMRLVICFNVSYYLTRARPISALFFQYASAFSL
jgi:hypothetical protein